MSNVSPYLMRDCRTEAQARAEQAERRLRLTLARLAARTREEQS